MKFSEALEECMKGKRITRKDWNGRAQFVYYIPPHDVPVKDWLTRDKNTELTDSEKLRGEVEILGHIDMVTNDGKRLIGWLASQYDLQSEDWEVLE